jgi:two-component system nitrate/nitrite response regulator NarL
MPSDHPEPTVTTVLVCDNALLRIGLQGILRETPFAPAVATSIFNLAVVQDMPSEPALVLIEASQNISCLLEVVRQVREQAPQACIVALADRFDLDLVRLGHEAGVNGFCSAVSAPAVLTTSLELVMLGESVLPFEVVRSIMDEAPQTQEPSLQSKSIEPSLSGATTCKLSAREAQILGCLKEGAPNKLIARKLDITEATIKVHIKAILRKIGVANRTQAAMWATAHLPPRGGAVQHL